MAKVAQSKPAQRSPQEKAHKKPVRRKTDEVKTKPEQVARPAYLQTKMAVSAPGDTQEQEADRVADEISRMPRGVARKAEPGVPPGSLKPENNAEMPQSLQTKISRMEEPEAQAKLCRQESAAETQQPAETAPETPSINDQTEQKIESLRGQGNPLSDEVRQDMEEKMNADFSSVSIHTGGEADNLCKQINARAFTVGSDIFFASGEFAPATEAGRKLLAHELTHVLQQQNGAQRKIFRDGPASGTAPASPAGAPPSVTVGTLQLPRFKASRHGDAYQQRIDAGLLYRPAGYSSAARTDRPSQSWDDDVDGSAITQKILDHIGTPEAGRVAPYIIMPKNSSNPTQLRMGTPAGLATRLKRPNWNRSGREKVFQVDHIVEMQLNGVDDPGNYELLESESNGASGRVISSGIVTTANNFLRQTSDPAVQAIPESKRNPESLKAEYNIKFDNYRGSLSAGRGEYWSKGEIETGEHMDFNRAVKIFDPLYPRRGAPFSRWPSGWNPAEYVGGAGVDGQPSTLVIYANEYGGKSKHISWPTDVEANHREPFPENRGASTWIRGFKLESISYSPGSSEGVVGNVRGQLFSNNDRLNFNGMPAQLDLFAMPGLPYVTHVNKASVEAQIRSIFSTRSNGISGASPIRVIEAGLDDDGVTVFGKLLPSIPMLQNADIDLVIRGNEVSIQKTFSSGELQVPSPFRLDDTSLTLAISNETGFSVTGRVNFGIDHLGEGYIEGGAATGTGEGGGFSLAGEFNFDERLFGEGTTAQVRVGYADEQWSMGGSITIPEGRVPGVASATIDVNYSEGDGFSARGDATLNIPGVESGTLEITQSEEAGFSIGGTFGLSADTPGIRGGSISATLAENVDGSGYAISARGEAQPDIPGINSNLIVSYDDGAFTAEVTAEYSRGMLSGSVNAGVTNRSVGEDGSLSDTAEPENPLIVYGGGTLTLQLAPWLQGTAGVQFAPNGEITVTGEIGLPDQLEIFSRREIDKPIFNIAVQVPIFTGVVAEIGGGLSASAGIGPGVIDQLRLGVTYNPDREEDTRITGDAHLNIPADAGLRLSVRAGIGLGITGASATGGLDIGGTLGIEGAAEAGVHVDWTPSDGLDLNADVAVHAQPSFTFDIGGYVSVRVFGASIYDERFEFASYTFGSDYRFGIRLPIHYREGEPFDISLDDVEFEVPDIDTNRLLRGLIDRIA